MVTEGMRITCSRVQLHNRALSNTTPALPQLLWSSARISQLARGFTNFVFDHPQGSQYLAFFLHLGPQVGLR
jgi:hypothetical protein